MAVLFYLKSLLGNWNIHNRLKESRYINKLLIFYLDGSFVNRNFSC